MIGTPYRHNVKIAVKWILLKTSFSWIGTGNW